MNELLAVVGSVTGATGILRDLKRKGYEKVVVVNTPNSLGNGGCSYSVKFREEIKAEFFEAARRRKVKIRGVYKIFKDERGESIYESVS